MSKREYSIRNPWGYYNLPYLTLFEHPRNSIVQATYDWSDELDVTLDYSSAGSSENLAGITLDLEDRISVLSIAPFRSI